MVAGEAEVVRAMTISRVAVAVGLTTTPTITTEVTADEVAEAAGGDKEEEEEEEMHRIGAAVVGSSKTKAGEVVGFISISTIKAVDVADTTHNNNRGARTETTAEIDTRR